MFKQKRNSKFWEKSINRKCHRPNGSGSQKTSWTESVIYTPLQASVASKTLGHRSVTKFSIPLNRRVSMTSYLFSLLIVTTHALRLMSLSSNHLHHRSFCMLFHIFGASFLHHSEFRILIILLAIRYIISKIWDWDVLQTPIKLGF